MARRHADLVLINPNSKKRAYQGLAAELTAVEPPVWAGLLATFVRQQGYEVAIVDAEAEELTPAEAAARVDEANPRLVAIVVYGHQPSASTQVMPATRELCQALKEHTPGRPVLLVGGHVAALPERTMREEAADFVAGGEGLHTLVDLLAALAAPTPDWSQVRDLWFHDGPEVRFSGRPAPLVRDLDQAMPGVAWDLLPMARYRAHNWHCLGGLARQPYAAIYTTLGCPYHCSFCCIQAPFKSGEAQLGLRATVNSYRFWSPDRVVDELEWLQREFGVRNVKFADEMFVLNRRHVEGICDRIITRGLDLNLWAYARVDTVPDGLAEKLRRAGFRWLALGIEAASPRVRDGVQKGFGQEEVFATLGRLRAAGIHVIGNFIFGLPEDDLATMAETLQLALELNCEFANFYCAMAYPGSPLYQEAQARGWALPSSWSGYAQHAVDTLPLPTKYVSAGAVLRFRDEAFQTYYRSPRYLEMVKQQFGEATLQHIRFMTAHPLERRFAAPATPGRGPLPGA